LREEKFLEGAKPARGGRRKVGFSGASHNSPKTGKGSFSILFLKIDRERELIKSRTCEHGRKK
jgi:hypothetical protein